MNVQLPLQPLDKPAFLAWQSSQEDRYELADGRIMMMTRASRAHAVIVGNLQFMLRDRLDARAWAVLSDFGLDAGPKTLRFPDIVVDRAGGSGSDYVAVAPALVAEVLSPSTTAIDLGDKAAEYLRLPTLAAYLVFAQDEPKAWVWIRTAGEFNPGPEVLVGIEAVIRIPAPQLSLPLAEIYSGLGTS
jgi:Uma2 family endonuclease